MVAMRARGDGTVGVIVVVLLEQRAALVLHGAVPWGAPEQLGVVGGVHGVPGRELEGEEWGIRKEKTVRWRGGV